MSADRVVMGSDRWSGGWKLKTTPGLADVAEALGATGRPFEAPGIDRRAFTYYNRLRRLERYVAEHYDQPVSLATAASVAGLEETYFSKFFHAKTGVCFHDWLAHVRVGKARELLRSANLSITETGQRVGFNDLGTFERTFKRCAGSTPVAYKKAVRPGH